MNNENYIDYTVENDTEVIVSAPKKKYSATKIVAMVLGIVAAFGYLYYAIQNVFLPYAEQFELINEYKNSGMMEVGFAIMLPYYVSIALVVAIIVAPIVGSLLPEKFKSTSLILIALPIAWQSIDIIPALISYLTQGTAFGELIMFFVICISSLMLLASAILTANCGKCKDDLKDEDFEVEYFEYEDDGVIVEEAMEIPEEIVEEVEEIFEEVSEEIKEEASEEN